MLNTLEKGKTYVFVEHPAYNTPEMQSVHHIGYEDVAVDRQGVVDLFTSERVKQALREKGIERVSYNAVFKALPRSTPHAEKVDPAGIKAYFEAVKQSGQELHSLMVLRHGKVVAERWFDGHSPAIPHVMHSVSKTWTSTAVGFAVQEGRLKVSDKVIKYFPDDLPAKVTPWLADLEIRDLLTMSVGHATEPSVDRTIKDLSWEKVFLSHSIEYEPGTKYLYNSMATYMVAAILQKVTGQTLLDYLYPRLLRPLGVTGAFWETSPSGVNCGGWGLHIKTEDMAKLGQFYLQKGKWNGRQLLNEAWIDEATTAHITQPPQWFPKDGNPKESDWVQGYGYQIWRCRHNAFRADGAVGQFIIVIPDKDAVVVTTANINDMQGEINLIWEHLLPAMK
jgi:CubicO group peptidase (beta-lactamase class C family)